MIEPFPAQADQQVRLKRAKMRAWRRGMREMDLILGGFIDQHGASLAPEKLDAFERLLARRDQDLYDWISGRVFIDEASVTNEEASLIEEIRANWRVFEKNSP